MTPRTSTTVEARRPGGAGGWRAGLALAALLFALAAPAAGRELLDCVIAVVSGTVITLSDARTALQFGLVDAGGEKDPVAVAMQWLVDRQLVLDEVNRTEVSDGSAGDVDAAFAQVRKRLAAGRGEAAALAALGLDQEGARRFVRDTVRVRQYLERRFAVVMPGTDAELRAYYAANAGVFSGGGLQLSFDEARPAVERAYQDVQRARAVASWLDRLRRRTEVNELYVPAR